MSYWIHLAGTCTATVACSGPEKSVDTLCAFDHSPVVLVSTECSWVVSLQPGLLCMHTCSTSTFLTRTRRRQSHAEYTLLPCGLGSQDTHHRSMGSGGQLRQPQESIRACVILVSPFQPCSPGTSRALLEQSIDQTVQVVVDDVLSKFVPSVA